MPHFRFRKTNSPFKESRYIYVVGSILEWGGRKVLEGGSWLSKFALSKEGIALMGAWATVKGFLGMRKKGKAKQKANLDAIAGGNTPEGKILKAVAVGKALYSGTIGKITSFPGWALGQAAGGIKSAGEYTVMTPWRATDQIEKQGIDIAKTTGAGIALPLSPLVHPAGAVINEVSYYTRVGLNKVFDLFAVPSGLRFKAEKQQRESFVEKTSRRMRQLNPLSFCYAVGSRARKIVFPSKEESEKYSKEVSTDISERETWSSGKKSGGDKD